MNKDELKAKYGRIANDPSQLEMFKNDVIDGEVAGGIPDAPTEAGTFVLTSTDGVIEWAEGGTSDPIAKGSIIKLGEDEYRVLSVNEDLTDCEVMHLGPATLSKFSNASASQDPSAGTTFIVNGSGRTGLKYEGSALDQACEAFYDALPADVKAAIIEQEVEQDMYDVNVAEGTEDFAIDNTAEGGMIYRFKKINDAPVAVGTRHAYALSCAAIKDYFGGMAASGVDVGKIFQTISWFKDAQSGSYSCCLFCGGQSGVYVYNLGHGNLYCVCPAFHIDLTKVNL